MLRAMTARLITIPFSHYCEKARWALDRRGIAFVEEAHLPMMHARHTRKLGGRSTPLLVLDGPAPRTLTDSTDILRFADEAGPRGDLLFPPGDEQTVALEARFDDGLGPHARRLGYFELLRDDRALRALVMRAAVPTPEKVIGVPALPLFKFLLRRGLNITPESAARSEKRVREAFDIVEAQLADGRRFLTGDRFTAADLTFASLAAPVLVPRGYQKFLLPYDEVPAAFRARIEEWRATKAGAFAMRVYDTERAT
jgi:glutathione S-transferase